MKVLAFGEVLFDIIEKEKYIGGAPLNFAAHLSKMGVDSYLLSSVGMDDLGYEVLKKVEALKVNIEYIRQDATHPTGVVKVELRKGQPDYSIIEDVAYDYIKSEGIDHLLSKKFDVLYFGTLAQRSSVSRGTLEQVIAKGRFKEIFYDVNLRKDFYTKEIIANSLRACTILKLNDDEVSILGPLLFKKSHNIELFAKAVAENYNIKIVIITAGGNGSFIYHKNEFHFAKGFPATIEDTVGAGDSFSAAFLFTYHNTGDIMLAAQRSNQLGAFVASSKGAIPDYSEELQQMLLINPPS